MAVRSKSSAKAHPVKTILVEPIAHNPVADCLRIYFCFVSVVFDFAFGGVSVFASRYPAFLASSSDMNLPRLVLP